jgi:hypothetical protein
MQISGSLLGSTKLLSGKKEQENPRLSPIQLDGQHEVGSKIKSGRKIANTNRNEFGVLKSLLGVDGYGAEIRKQLSAHLWPTAV